MDGRRRAGSDSSLGMYAAQEARGGARVTFADQQGAAGGRAPGAGTAGDGGKRASDFVSSRKSMGLRAVVMSTNMTIKTKCDELTRFVKDLTDILERGSSGPNDPDVVNQFREHFPRFVSALFGLPFEQIDESTGGPAAPETIVSWLQQATTVEDFEALYQFLHAKSPLVTLLMKLPLIQDIPFYPFPQAALPEDLQLMVLASSDSTRLVGNSIAVADAAFFASRINRVNQPGLTLNVWEYWLFAFAWFATQNDSEESRGLDPLHYRTMTNVLYSSLLRQYALTLFESEACNSQESYSTPRRAGFGASSDASAHEGPFGTFVATLAEFWLHQNPVLLFTSVSSAAAASSSLPSVLRYKYRPPTFLMLSGIHDLLTLVFHNASDVTVFRPTENSRYRADYGVSSNADRIMGMVFRDLLIDPLYRTLKLGLLLAPHRWSYLVSLWSLVCTPWTQTAAPDAYAQLALMDEQKQAAYAVMHGSSREEQQLRRQLLEDLPFSTLVPSPYDPASLKSPFVVPPRVAPPSPAPTLSGSNLLGGLNFTSIFGSNYVSPIKSLANAAASFQTSPTTKGAAGAPGEVKPLDAPQNWSWFTFHDATAPIGCWKRAEPRQQDAELWLEARTYVACHYPLYTPLLHGWIAAAHDVFVKQPQPINQAFIVLLHNALACFNGAPLNSVLRELDAVMVAALDHRRPVARELEQRGMLERAWQMLERA
jgi:hypothetical protein